MAEKNSVAEQPVERLMVNLSCEDALLIHCARLDISPEVHQAIKDILTEGVDWELLTQKAIWHRLLLLVSYHLRSPDLSMFVPKPVLEKMKSLHYPSLARNMVLQDELSRLLSAFNKQEIPVIVLKGAALLESIYGDISLRPMGDLDILVRPEHLGQAEAIAFKQGYGFLVNQELQEQTRQNCRHLANLWHQERKIMLEIHHHIVSHDEPYYFNLDGFWARAKPVTLAGAHALTLAPEDLLIHLSIKFLLDRRYQSNNALGQLCDISEVIKHYTDSLDWDLIEKTSQENGVLKGLHFVLHTCRLLLNTPVPASVLDRFQPREFAPASAEQFIRRRVLDTRPWLAHGLLDSQPALRRRITVLAIVSRASNFTREIFKNNGNEGNTGPFNLRRVRNILPKLGRVLLRPTELKEDLKLDRWLHDLYNAK